MHAFVFLTPTVARSSDSQCFRFHSPLSRCSDRTLPKSSFLGREPTKAFEASTSFSALTPQHQSSVECIRASAVEADTARVSVADQIKSALLITAIKTPFLPSGEIDIDTFDALAQEQVRKGVNGLVVGGTTGSGHLMNESELLGLIGHAVDKFGDKLVVVGNTGGMVTSKALSYTRKGFAHGMHASLQINPYYGKTSDAGIVAHITPMLDEGPAIVYNVPGRTGQDIKPNVISKLNEHGNLMGVKECMGNDRIAAYAKQGIMCWSGNDDQCFEGRHASGSGVISVASNLFPGLMRRLMDDPSATALNGDLQAIIGWLFCEPNPIAIDTVLAMTGFSKPVFRLPYVPLSREQRQTGLDLLSKIPAAEIVGSERRLLDDSDFVLVDSY